MIRKLRFAFLFYFWLIDLMPKERLNAMKELAGLAGPARLAGRAGGERPEGQIPKIVCWKMYPDKPSHP